MGVPHLVRARNPAVDLRTQQRERVRLALRTTATPVSRRDLLQQRVDAREARLRALLDAVLHGGVALLGRLEAHRLRQLRLLTEILEVERLQVVLPNELEIRVERIFDAPRTHLYSVWTDPELIPQWWGDDTVVEEMDVRPGGTYRFRTAFGVVEGEFREVEPPQRLVQTFQW